ncbi:MAG: hypothetical protein IT440_13565 [Phycisphaeraceae bacterium]|nr:hypothetical protein [Phycisphaeraceae bacterium]
MTTKACEGPNEPFVDANGKPRRLRGAIVSSGSVRLCEMAARVGFETVWLEMEHGSADFSLLELQCMACQAGGAIPTVRTADSQRTNILRAMEAGARIVVTPMVDTPEQAMQMVEAAKYPPLGKRGYYTRSRGVGYGLGCDPASLMKHANEATHLFPQVETLASVANLDALLRVPGLSGLFIGPGDLSVAMGCPGDMNDPRLISMVIDCIARIRRAGKHAGILVGAGKMLDAAMDAGADLVFSAGDLSLLAKAWSQELERMDPGRGLTANA